MSQKYARIYEHTRINTGDLTTLHCVAYPPYSPCDQTYKTQKTCAAGTASSPADTQAGGSHRGDQRMDSQTIIIDQF